jgi:hypothetical protein
LIFVIADAHGRYDLVRRLLEQEGLPSKGVFVVQLGDLANCVIGSEHDDLEALSLVGGAIDLMLVGNHEHPYFDGPPFSGFFPHPSVKERLHSLNDRQLLEPSYVAPGHRNGNLGSILLTHAGVSRYLNAPAHFEESSWETAESADEELRWAWRTNPKYPIFSAVGRERYGWDPYGGILWSDWHEPKTLRFRQLIGHTPAEKIRRRDRATCIDLGAGKGRSRLAGAWIVNGRIRTVVYEATTQKPPRTRLAARR